MLTVALVSNDEEERRQTWSSFYVLRVTCESQRFIGELKEHCSNFEVLDQRAQFSGRFPSFLFGMHNAMDGIEGIFAGALHQILSMCKFMAPVDYHLLTPKEKRFASSCQASKSLLCGWNGIQWNRFFVPAFPPGNRMPSHMIIRNDASQYVNTLLNGTCSRIQSKHYKHKTRPTIQVQMP